MSVIADFAPKRSPGELSNVPSELIRQTVADVRWVLKQPKIVFDLGVYCSTNGKCRVCCAGALILRRIAPVNEATAQSQSFGWQVSDDVDALLMAVNELRCGALKAFICGCRRAGHRISDAKIRKILIEAGAGPFPGYINHRIDGQPTDDQAKAWCREILKVAEILEKHGH
jgi:hypothetical protein